MYENNSSNNLMLTIMDFSIKEERLRHPVTVENGIFCYL